jgi:phosphoribulokinase
VKRHRRQLAIPHGTAVRQLVELIGRLQTRPLLVAIDGRSGAGKSTFARTAHQQITEPSIVVEGDDFYRAQPEAERLALDAGGGYERYFDWQRLEAQVLTPARRGAPRLRYQRFDWGTGTMGAWVDVAMPPILIVEGVYTLRPQLRPLVDLAIFVDTDDGTRLARQLARNENTDDWIRRWGDAGAYYIQRHDPAATADLVVGGD